MPILSRIKGEKVGHSRIVPPVGACATHQKSRLASSPCGCPRFRVLEPGFCSCFFPYRCGASLRRLPKLTVLALNTAASNNRSMRRLMVIALACTFLTTSAKAVRELVILEQPQLAQRLEGIVLDPSGAPIADMTVTDRTENGVAVLRTTKTDDRGYFHFPSQRGKTAYCLRFDHPLFNPLQLTLKLDKHALQRGITARPDIGG